MKKYITIIVLILLTSCSNSNDKITEIRESKCDCKQIVYQVTPHGALIKRSSIDVSILCIDDKKKFNIKYNGDRLIEYTQYNCD